jgi:hypothetical protein
VNTRERSDAIKSSESALRALRDLLARDGEGGVSAGQVQRAITSLEVLPLRDRWRHREVLKMLREMKAARL